MSLHKLESYSLSDHLAPMIELKIETAEKALCLLQEGWPTVAASLVGDDLRFPLPKFGPHHLIVRFHDIEQVGVQGYEAPTKEHVRAVLDHTAGLSAGDRLLVHCHAGKSRSPAMAIGILIQSGLSPEAAYQRVKEVRPELIPNRLLSRYIDEELGLHGELVRIVEAHYDTLGHGAKLPSRGGLHL